jgi:RHS repeat-associated protein
LTINGQSGPEHRYASNVKWHPNGALASFDRGNGISHSTIQNVRGLPYAWTDNGVLQDRYLYDQNANVSAIEDWQQWVNGRSMAYDGLDRLTTANGPWGAGQYSYDALDNIRSSTVGSRSLSHTYDGSNKLTGVTGSQHINFGYDANGNITNRGGQTFGFDIGNRMTRADGKANYLYDAEGRRSWATFADGSKAGYAYGQDGKLRISGHTVHGTDWYIYLGDRLIAQYQGGRGTSYNHTDALGSPVARSDQYGTITSRTMFEAYGATASGSIPSGVGIGFTGHVNDADTGLVYMQQRYYEPLAGRFLSVDPVVTDANSGMSFNRYSYVANNPYRYTDPDGRQLTECGSGSTMCSSTYFSDESSSAVQKPTSRAAAGALAPPAAAAGSGGSAISGTGLRAAAASAGRLLGPLSLAATPSSLSDGTLYGAAGLYAAKEGMTVYRVWGGLAGPLGRSWTPVNPDIIGPGLYRDMAGLPTVNDGSRLSIGQLINPAGVRILPADPLDGNRGGLPEYRVPNPALQIRILSTQERNPPF